MTEKQDRLPDDSPFRVRRVHQVVINERGVTLDHLISQIKKCINHHDIANPKIGVYSGYSYGGGYIQVIGDCPMDKVEMRRKAKALKAKEAKLRHTLAELEDTIGISSSESE